jgi:hypothetical protein
MSNLQALRENGEAIERSTLRNGRLFLIQEEPLIDPSLAANNTFRLVIFAKPGSQCIVQTRANLSEAGEWTDATGLQLNGTYHQMNWPMEGPAPLYFRIIRTN